MTPVGEPDVPHETSPGSASIRRVAQGGGVALAVFAAGAGLSYCAQLLLARSIGPDGYGVYATVFAWMTLLGYGAALGADVSLLRFIPAYRARGEWGLLRGAIVFAERSALVAGLGIGVAGMIVVRFAASGLSSSLAHTVRIGLPLVPLYALLWIRCSTVRAFGGVFSAIAPDRLLRDGLLILLIGLCTVIAPGALGAPAMMVVTVLSAAVALLAVSAAKRRISPARLGAAAAVFAGRTWAATALPLVAIGVADVAMNRSGVMLLGWAGHTTEAGLYALAFNVAFLSVLPRTAINALLAPAIADSFARNDRSGLQALAANASLWNLAGAACVAVPVAVLAEPILAWFGPAFAAAATTLRILLLGQLVVAGAGSQLYLLTMTGHERSAAWLMVAGGGANLLLGAGLVLAFGLTGAAVAGTLLLLLTNIALALLVWHHLRLLPGPLFLLLRRGGRAKPERPRRPVACLLRVLAPLLGVVAVGAAIAAGPGVEPLRATPLVPPPFMPRPGYLQPAIDPAFGTSFTRVTGPGQALFPEVACAAAYCTHRYSSAQAWNADQTLLLIVNGCSGFCFLDGQTYRPAFHRGGSDECEWHPADPAQMICMNGTAIYLWRPRPDTRTVVFASKHYAGLQFGPYKGNPSRDGARIVVRARRDDGHLVAFAYDLRDGAKHADIELDALEGTNGFCGISPSGRYVFCVQTTAEQTSIGHVFTADGQPVQVWREHHRPGHGDMTIDADGEDVYVGISKADPDRYHIIKRRLRDGFVTDLAPYGEGQHASIRNVNRPGWVFLTYSGDYPELAVHPDWAPFYREIVALRIDGSGEVRRIAQTRDAKADYWGEAHASPSPDATQVIWSSNWGDPGSPVSDYVTRLRWPS